MPAVRSASESRSAPRSTPRGSTKGGPRNTPKRTPKSTALSPKKSDTKQRAEASHINTKTAANGSSRQNAPRFRFFDKALFSGISDANPIKCFARETAHKGIYTIAAYGIDMRGILSHMVGAMSLQRLEITSAASKNIRRASRDFFYNEFTADTRGAYTDAWFDNLQQFIAAQARLLYGGERGKARARLIDHIAQDYALGAGEAGAPPVIDIHIASRTSKNAADAPKEIQNGSAYEAAVEGKDARYLLYMLSAAFEQQNLSIETFFATTRESHVRDVFMLRSEAGEIDEHTLRINLMLTAQFTYYLRFAANPAKAMERFTELVQSLSETRGEYRDFARQFMDKNSEIASFFAQLLGSGDYLWEDFIRANSAQTMQALYGASAQRGMGLAPSQYASRCAAIAEAKSNADPQEAFEEKMRLLNQFKDEQSYFIDLDVLLHHGNSFKELSFRLSELARAVVRCAAGLAYDVLAHTHGHPKTAAGTQAQWVLCGLGKFGGSALGYASDIEIMLIYEDAGDTDGGASAGSASNSLSNRDFFSTMVELLQTRLRAKRDGIFQIDARLRPYGEDGPRAVRLDAFIKYYEKNGDAHGAERLALCRMRPIAGSPALAERVQSIRDALVYAPGAIDRREIFALRKEQLAEKVDPRTRNAKFGPGALVDVEYNIQMLQVEHGIAHPKLRQPHLHNAIASLQEVGEISEDERAAMTQAYDFFRALINALRLRRGNASDLTLPPDDSWELEHLARRMDYPSGEISAGRRLCADFDMHSAQVYRFVQKHLGEAAVASAASGAVSLTFAQSFEEARGALDDFTDPRGAFEAIRRCARPQGTDAKEMEEIARMFSRILLLAWPAITRSGEPDRVLRDFSRIAEAAAQPDGMGIRALYEMLLRQPTRLDMLCAVLTGSRHLSEELIKSPQVVSMISDKTVIQKQKDRAEYSAELFAKLREVMPEASFEDFSGASPDGFSRLVLKTLREYKNIETLRIISRDICLAAPFEHVVSEISALAASLARAAFAAAVYDLAADFGDVQPALERTKRFTEKSIAEIEKTIPVGVAAFGKFGAGELNYSSDLDLLCVYEERGGMHERLAISLMQRMNYYLTKHTEHGKLYRVDMRLRPHGDASPIANSLPFIASYYETDAELWELQAALKLGAVAGNLETARACIEAVHERAAARLSAISAKTITASARAMRVSSREEHFKRVDDERFEVKNSRGGLRDIEFAVQAMQLLQMRETPRRKTHPDTIGAIRTLSQDLVISAEEADAAIRDYVFLRRVEHFLQVYDDRQLHAIPLHDKTIMGRMAYLMTHEPDEDVFIKQLAAIKQQVRAWYDARMSHPLDAKKISSDTNSILRAPKKSSQKNNT